MRRSFTRYLRRAAILAGICSTAQAAVSGSVKMQPGLEITLNVYNWSHVDSETLIRAKQEAARIYREIGVETVWLDHPVDEAQQNSAPHHVSEIYVNIIPQATQGLGLLSNALGIAPGAGRNRGRLYVCYDRVEGLYRKQIAGTAQGKTARSATTAQISGLRHGTRDGAPARPGCPLQPWHYARGLGLRRFAEPGLWRFGLHSSAGRSDSVRGGIEATSGHGSCGLKRQN